MERTQILLSTYNGQTYLEGLLDSLLRQALPGVEILIRDDGSSDGTLEILRRYSEKHQNIRLIEGENVGVIPSFFQLVQEADGDFVAFCDQDDIWLPEKLQVAVDKIKSLKGPALYCSTKTLVDSKQNFLATIGEGFRPDFSNAVLENICTGCTAVMNHDLLNLMKAYTPKHCFMHDWWLYLLASYYGTVVYDDASHVWYRQHEDNVLGLGASKIDEIKAKAAHLKKNKGVARRQLQEFGEFVGTVNGNDPQKDALIQKITVKGDSFIIRCSLAFGHEFYRQKKLDELITRAMIFVGWYP